MNATDIRTWASYYERADSLVRQFNSIALPRGLPGWMVHNYNLLVEMGEVVTSHGPRTIGLADARRDLVLFANRLAQWTEQYVAPRGDRGYESE